MNTQLVVNGKLHQLHQASLDKCASFLIAVAFQNPSVVRLKLTATP